MAENGEQSWRAGVIVRWSSRRRNGRIEEEGRAMAFKHMSTPVGRLTLVAADNGLAAILWQNDRPGRVKLNVGAEVDDHPVLVETERQLEEYFAGRRKQFALTLDLSGTAFQRQVWNALLTIPFGETRSYGRIASEIGNPSAVRAVGAANGRNPVSIVVPCHRVVGSTGALTGFAGGLDVKAHLLAFESGLPLSRRPTDDGYCLAMAT
jgi:methylated-DNA-[protein]-cysteine S-methyltransferase